jgi:hypothetical protein
VIGYEEYKRMPGFDVVSPAAHLLYFAHISRDPDGFTTRFLLLFQFAVREEQIPTLPTAHYRIGRSVFMPGNDESRQVMITPVTIAVKCTV